MFMLFRIVKCKLVYLLPLQHCILYKSSGVFFKVCSCSCMYLFHYCWFTKHVSKAAFIHELFFCCFTRVVLSLIVNYLLIRRAVIVICTSEIGGHFTGITVFIVARSFSIYKQSI